MKVGKQEGRKGDTVTREGRDFVLILTNHYNWSQRVPRVISLSLIINPLFFFFDSSLSDERKRQGEQKTTRASRGVLTFIFICISYTIRKFGALRFYTLIGGMRKTFIHLQCASLWMPDLVFLYSNLKSVLVTLFLSTTGLH
jgi:hypothetical protein